MRGLEKEEKKIRFMFVIFLVLILILLLISIVNAADNSGNLVPVQQGEQTTTGQKSRDFLKQSIDSAKGIKIEDINGGKRIIFNDANNQIILYDENGKSYTLSGIEPRKQGFNTGFIEVGIDGKVTKRDYKMGEKGSAQVFGGNLKAYIPGGASVFSSDEKDIKVTIPENNEGVKETPKILYSNKPNNVNIHYKNTGKIRFLDDKGVEKFELRGKGDEITHDGEKYSVQPGKSINANGLKIPVSIDKGAVKFYPDGKIPDSEKGTAVGFDLKNKNLFLKGSELESSPKIEILKDNDFSKNKDVYFSAQAGKGSGIQFNGNNFQFKPSGSSWTIIDGNKIVKGINGEVYTETLQTPPSGMSAEDFKKIKSQGEIIPVDENGKSILLDSKGKQYKMVTDENNNLKTVLMDSNSQDPRVIYGDNPSQVTQQPSVSSEGDLQTPPDYEYYKSSDTTYKSKNFIVNSPNGNARAYATALEYWRWRNAIEWNGKSLPDWSRPFVVNIKEGDYGNTGITYYQGGKGLRAIDTKTGISYTNPYVYGVNGGRIEIEGTFDGILQKVIPHETMHTISPQIFNNEPPTWIKEGIATSTATDKYKDPILNDYQTQEKVYNIKDILEARRFPVNDFDDPSKIKDIWLFYSQSDIMVEYLINLGGGGTIGKIKLTNAVNYATQYGWGASLKNNYGFGNPGEFQQSMNKWLNKNKN